jgi:hypothetical protein
MDANAIAGLFALRRAVLRSLSLINNLPDEVTVRIDGGLVAVHLRQPLGDKVRALTWVFSPVEMRATKQFHGTYITETLDSLVKDFNAGRQG